MLMRSIFVVFCWSLFSCGSVVTINYYSLDDLQETNTWEGFNRCLAVENFRSAPYLDRQEIILRRSQDGSLDIMASELWWATPNQMMTEITRNSFLQSKMFRSVYSYPTSYKVDYLLEGYLHRFEIDSTANSTQVRIAVQINLVDHTTGQIVWNSPVIDRSASAASSTIPDGVRAMSSLARDISQEVMEKIHQQVENSPSSLK